MTTSENQTKVELSDVEVDRAAKMHFHTTVQLIEHYSKAMSSRNLRRALYAALMLGVDDTKIRFIHKQEPEIAALIAKAIDFKILLKAQQLKQKEEENEKKPMDSTGHSADQDRSSGET